MKIDWLLGHKEPNDTPKREFRVVTNGTEYKVQTRPGLTWLDCKAPTDSKWRGRKFFDNLYDAVEFMQWCESRATPRAWTPISDELESAAKKYIERKAAP